MNPAKQSCIFGPIPSRRLGISLGVDLIPFKTCSMDCIYCECGKTTSLTTERKEYFPTELAISQIDQKLKTHPHIDYITFSGTGEPTLHSGIGKIIDFIKKEHPEVKLCLLTNSFSLTDENFLKELLPLDLIVPSLDGSNEEEFRKMNRPAENLRLAEIADGIARFKRISKTAMWLEIFIARGINDTRDSALRFRELVRKIAPDKVQLNTLDRPGTEHNVEIPPPETMNMMAEIIGEAAPVELVGGCTAKKSEPVNLSTEEYNEKIIAAVASRPCTAEDLALSLNFRIGNLEAYLRRMEKAGLLTSEKGPRGIYYRAVKPQREA